MGKPVDLSDLQGGPITRTTLDAATNRIMDALTGLVAELRGGTPPVERWDPAARNQKQTGRNFESPAGEAQ